MNIKIIQNIILALLTVNTIACSSSSSSSSLSSLNSKSDIKLGQNKRSAFEPYSRPDKKFKADLENSYSVSLSSSSSSSSHSSNSSSIIPLLSIQNTNKALKILKKEKYDQKENKHRNHQKKNSLKKDKENRYHQNHQKDKENKCHQEHRLKSYETGYRKIRANLLTANINGAVLHIEQIDCKDRKNFISTKYNANYADIFKEKKMMPGKPHHIILDLKLSKSGNFLSVIAARSAIALDDTSVNNYFFNLNNYDNFPILSDHHRFNGKDVTYLPKIFNENVGQNDDLSALGLSNKKAYEELAKLNIQDCLIPDAKIKIKETSHNNNNLNVVVDKNEFNLLKQYDINLSVPNPRTINILQRSKKLFILINPDWYILFNFSNNIIYSCYNADPSITNLVHYEYADFSPSNRFLIIYDTDSDLYKVWDLVLQILVFENVKCVTFSEDETVMACVDQEGNIRIYESLYVQRADSSVEDSQIFEKVKKMLLQCW